MQTKKRYQNEKGGEEVKIITISNQKGGVGKTTTTQTLAIGLAKKKKAVLVIDSDPQCNLTYTFDAMDREKTLYDLYNGEDINSCIYKTRQGVDIIAGNIRLKDSDKTFTELGKEYILSNALKVLYSEYDYILIDTPPTLSILTINALTCSDEVIIPMQADIFSMQGLSQLIKQIDAVKKYTNPKIKIAGVLLTKYSERNVLTRDLYKNLEKITNDMDLHLFKSTIRDAVLVKEAQAQKTNILDLDAKSKVAKDYMNFINEYMKGDK